MARDFSSIGSLLGGRGSRRAGNKGAPENARAVKLDVTKCDGRARCTTSQQQQAKPAHLTLGRTEDTGSRSQVAGFALAKVVH